MKIPQFLPWLGEDEYKAISVCFETNWITEGPIADKFNKQLLKLTGAKYGVFAPNGTLGLYLALKAIGIKPGDEVIVPDFTFIGSSNAIEMIGAIPVFVDVNKNNFQIDVTNAHRLITNKTKAIMPVHIYGTIANMDSVQRFAETHNLLIIEDAAQAIGVHYKGQHAGTFGKIGVFSFFADKTITTGEGSFIITNDEKIYDKLLYLRNQGRKHRGTFIHPEMGYNFRMTDIQCAIGLVQLGKLHEIIRRKEIIKEKYEELLKNIPQLTFFKPENNAEWIPFRMAVLCRNAHELMAYLMDKNIEPRTFFYPLHRQPCYKNIINPINLMDTDFPNTVYAYENGICLPTYPTLTVNEIEHICSLIKKFYEEN
jgi:perosamine synthetase